MQLEEQQCDELPSIPFAVESPFSLEEFINETAFDCEWYCQMIQNNTVLMQFYDAVNQP